MHPYGKNQLLRCVLLGCGFYLAAAAIGVATDEPGAAWSARSARLGALGPLVAALSAATCAATARRHGATRALLALGVSPWRVHRGERLGAWLLGALGVALAVGPWSDSASLFPQIDGSVAWQRLADGSLYSALGVTWNAQSGFGAVPPEARLSPSWTLASLALLGPASLILPAWVLNLAPPRGPSFQLLSAGTAMALASVFALSLIHAVAADRIAPHWLVFGCAPLVLHGALQRRVA